MHLPNSCRLGLVLVLLAGTIGASESAAGYGSIQEALDRNPGRMVFVPAGDHAISEPIRIRTAGAGLWGPGRIVQSNPDAPIIEATRVPDLQLREITVTRAAGRQEATKSAIVLTQCENAVVAGVQVLDNWSNASALSISECARVQVRNCLVRNYSRIAIDDRTKTSFLGYAFTCIDGTGLTLRNCTGALISGNRVVEQRMIPTPALKEKYQLGKFVKKNAEKGWRVSQEMWDSEYFNGWHQGSAIVVTSGEASDFIQILGNTVENAAQGIDIHSDHVILANNVVTNAFIGMKAVHGSRNVIVAGNQFSRNDLWAIGLMPGTASHRAGEAVELSGGRRSGTGANVDGYSVIANNLISDFGYGQSHWNWPISSGGMAPLRLGTQGLAEHGKAPVRDVIVQGNLVYDTGRDQVLVDGQPRTEPPRYRHALKLAQGPDAPQGVVLANNLLHPGTEGVIEGEFPDRTPTTPGTKP